MTQKSPSVLWGIAHVFVWPSRCNTLDYKQYLLIRFSELFSLSVCGCCIRCGRPAVLVSCRSTGKQFEQYERASRKVKSEGMAEIQGHTAQPATADCCQWHSWIRFASCNSHSSCTDQAAGKTTLAAKVSQRLNELKRQASPTLGPSGTEIAIFLPMDGYHLTREQLSAMPDSHTAHARRGAAFTFDAPAFLKLVKKLREPICPETSTIFAPSFDHAKKDPVENDLPISASARVIVIEGNYLSLGSGAEEWKQAAELMDELWFVEVPEDVARKRLISRHVASGIAANAEDAAKRADENDLVNGREIISGRLEVHEIVQSREDDAWKPEAQKIDKERDA